MSSRYVGIRFVEDGLKNNKVYGICRTFWFIKGKEVSSCHSNLTGVYEGEHVAAYFACLRRGMVEEIFFSFLDGGEN